MLDETHWLVVLHSPAVGSPVTANESIHSTEISIWHDELRQYKPKGGLLAVFIRYST